MQDESLSTPVWLRRVTKLTAGSTLFLIFAGAMVTSTGSGLAVPDWPLAYGKVFPPMVGGIFFEHGHRMVASAVGLLVLIQAFALQFREPKSHVRALGWLALSAVVLQGVLGGLTVLFRLPLAVSVGHASLAEIFFCLTVAIAFSTSRLAAGLEEGTSGPGLSQVGKLFTAGFFLQIALGALMRHLGAGLAIPDFPLSFGKVFPSLTSIPVVVAYAHRSWGIILGCFLIGFAASVLHRARGAARTAFLTLVCAVIAQILLGGFTIWSGKHPVVTSLHVVTGAFVLATSLVFTMISSRTESAGQGVESGEEVAA